MISRRRFLVSAGVVTTAAGSLQAQTGETPWYLNCYRWSQTNNTEKDGLWFDVPWWREQWKRSEVQAVIISCTGAEITWYPTMFPLRRRNSFRPERDLFGELVEAAQKDGIAVVARVDNAAATEELRQAHPDWLTRNRDGQPGTAPCSNSPYQEEYLANIFREVIERYHPASFADNGGVVVRNLCYCKWCSKKFRDDTGQALPDRPDWNNAVYRQWHRWSKAQNLDVWDANNRATKAAGGPHCLYIGMVRKFQDYVRDIAKRMPLLMMDSQSRNDEGSFRENADEARYLHSLVGWNNVIVQCSSMTQHSHGYFRVTSDPPAEARMYLKAGFAGGWGAWAHYISAYSEDRRQYEIVPPVMRWHKQNERYLGNRTPVATVGVLRSDLNSVFYARGAASQLVHAPYRGIVSAFFRTRIPYLPLHIEDLEREAPALSVLVLPNIGAMSDKQCDSVRIFVERGGSLIATGVTSLYDEEGELRPDFALASVLGTHVEGAPPDRTAFAAPPVHSYLRLLPEIGGLAQAARPRHMAFAGFEETNLIPFGGSLTGLRVDPDRTVLCTYVPPFPRGPAQNSWMREERTTVPGLIVGNYGRGRVAYLPADLDGRYSTEPLPDHGLLLGNLLRWAAGDNVPFSIDGAGYIGGYLYRQEDRLILHLLNGTGTDNGQQLSDRYFPVGPLRIKVKVPSGLSPKSVRLLVSERPVRAAFESVVEFEIAQLVDHEVVVIE